MTERSRATPTRPAPPSATPPVPSGGKAEPRPNAGEVALRRDMPLVPISSIVGRALVTVIAIMTFLSALTAGVAMMVASASQDWRHAVAREMTIQIRPVAGRDLEAEVVKATTIARAAPGVGEAIPFDAAAGERLLEPWLGQGLDLHDLPIPRLIVVKPDGRTPVDAAALRTALDAGVSGVSLDDHHLWLDRLAAMADTVVGVALVILALVLAATGLTVGFATRGAMAGNQEIVGVLHFVGAEDRFIAKEFQSHFLRLGLKGGAIGGACAVALLLAAGGFESWMIATPGGDQLEALFGGFSIGPAAAAAMIVIALVIALITGLVSRSVVYRHLQAFE